MRTITITYDEKDGQVSWEQKGFDHPFYARPDVAMLLGVIELARTAILVKCIKAS